jgi:starch phosphorylase
MTPQTYIFAAKAAPGYYMAKKIIELIVRLSKDIANNPLIREKLNVVFLEDYSVTMAEKLMPASEISEQISLAGKEASGTGNMKFMINGALTLGTLDGANVEIAEAVGMDNIFIFGMTAPEVNELWRAGYNSTFFYNSNQDLKEVMKSFNKGFDNQSFEDITAYLLTSTAIADAYMCLADYDSYMKAYHYMDEVYQDQRLFNRMSLINISEAGRFAADRSIEEYAQRIWYLKKVK